MRLLTSSVIALCFIACAAPPVESVDQESSYLDYSMLADKDSGGARLIPVSYTHLTLPTIYSV